DDGRSLIDGIGLQAHLFTADDVETYLKGVDTLAATGLKLELTEVDVGLGKYEGALSNTDENLKMQGRYCYELFQGLFERADAGTIRMDAVTFWGFSDGFSWRREYSPQLYDRDLDPKYALYGVMQIKEYAGYDPAE
ncbi:MAG: endo-1,4-beta-xylanase, partial [Lachnospiraceae bacterium]|nr:endo-1,4-beta-xylanase [Lachnospiraceae bacterium]